MRKRYTPSNDRILRCRVRATLRLDRDEMGKVMEMSKEEGVSFQDKLDILFADGVFTAIVRRDDARREHDDADVC